MFEHRITTSNAIPLDRDDPLGSVEAMLSAVHDFAAATGIYDALQHQNSALTPHSPLARYATANSITRRRFDAILRETEAVARTGLGLILGRAERHDAATIAAARFLGNSIAASLRKLENLVASHAA